MVERPYSKIFKGILKENFDISNSYHLTRLRLDSKPGNENPSTLILLTNMFSPNDKGDDYDIKTGDLTIIPFSKGLVKFLEQK